MITSTGENFKNTMLCMYSRVQLYPISLIIIIQTALGLATQRLHYRTDTYVFYLIIAQLIYITN